MSLTDLFKLMFVTFSACLFKFYSPFFHKMIQKLAMSYQKDKLILTYCKTVSPIKKILVTRYIIV